MNSGSRTLILILGFCSYLAVESTCPLSGIISKSYSVVADCNDIGLGVTTYPIITWSDSTTSTLNNTITFSYVSGQLVGTGTGTVLSGRFVGLVATTQFIHANATLACTTDGISDLPGSAQLNIIGLGVLSCIGTANIAFNPPLTNTPTLVQKSNTVNYSTCIGLLLC